MAEPIRKVLPRALARLRLAPLDPDAFLAWAFHAERVRRQPWESPLTLDDLVFEYQRLEPSTDVTEIREETRRTYIRLAAKVRRNQRLGLDPWEGIF